MKKITFLALLIISFSLSSQTYFEKVINVGSTTNSNNMGLCVEQTSDGGFIISAMGLDGSNFYDNAYLLKTDSLGNVLWKRSYQTFDFASGNWAMETRDGNYVLLSEESAINPLDIHLMKYNSNGGLIWRDFLFDRNDTVGNRYMENRAFYCSETADSGIVLCGHKAYNHISYLYVIKTNSRGDTLWKTLPVTNLSTTGYCIKPTADNGYIVTAAGDGNYPNSGGLNIIKLDSVGNLIWLKRFSNATVSQGNSIEIMPDNGFVIAGGNYNSVTSQFDNYIIRMNSMGDTMWTKTYPYPACNNIRRINNTQFLMSSTYSIGSVYKVLLSKTDTSGVFIDSTTFHSSYANYNANCLSLTRDGNFCFVGQVAVGNTYYVYFVKSNQITNGIKTYYDDNSITISPNPFTSLTTISFTQEQTNTIIKITDVLGKEIKTINFTGKELIIMKGTMQAGIYFVQITDANKNIVNRKVVVQ